MTSSCEPARSRVIRKDSGTALAVRPARLTADLRTSPFASTGRTDARLVDPVLEQAVEERAARAEEQGRAVGYAEGYAQGRAAAAAEALEQQARDAEEQAAVAAAQRAELEQARQVRALEEAGQIVISRGGGTDDFVL